MSNNSTLGQLSSQSQVKIGDQEIINTKKILNDLLRSLSDKEKDIIRRRFGLDRPERETLEKVGRVHGLTRERIRQIENSIINQKLNQIKESRQELLDLKNLVIQLLEEHGGLMEKHYFFNILDGLSAPSLSTCRNDLKTNHFDFLFSRVLSNELEEIKNSSRLKKAYRLKSHDLDHFEELAEELVSEVKNLKQILKLEELLELIAKLASYNKHEHRFNLNHSLDITHMKDTFFDSQEFEIAINRKPIYSFLQVISDIEVNKFGFWGHKDWGEVLPRTINDKIYLVLKNEGRPMHFNEIANRINEVKFDYKKSNPATIHNELILDEKYVLIGRGIYGLKDWGLKKGTVVDVIVDILNKTEKPMSREEIVDKVLETRVVKRSTVNLALSNRKLFQKTSDNKYILKTEN